jgi:ribosomal protein L40E
VNILVYCETCGTENSQTAKYCKSCGGTILRTENKSVSPPIPPNGDTSIGFGHRNTGENLVLRCSLCSGQDFAKDSGRLDSKWGWTSFKVIMLSCRRCGHIELFNKGRSIWDFD